MATTPQGTNIRIGHVFLDLKRRVLRCLNQAAKQLYAEGVPLTASDPGLHLLLTPGGETVTGTDLPLVRAYLEDQTVEAEFLLPREGGSPWRVSWTAAPVRNSRGQITGVLGTLVCGPPEPDWQIMAELAHDLSTPLHSLRLLCAVLDQLPPDATELRKPLESIRASADRALQIGKELLERCRGPVPGGPRGEASWFALEPFLAGLAQEQTPAAERKGLALRTDFEAARGWDIHLDRVRLGRLLSNLLVNAVRYTARGQVEFTAEWQEDGERHLALSVVDTGTGIDQEEKESIFQPFERGKAGKEGDSSGSGLGLAVVDRLVEELGLALDVYSEHGRGSAFHLLIPAHFMRPGSGSLRLQPTVS